MKTKNFNNKDFEEALAEQPAQQEPVAWMWRCKPYCGWPEWSVSLKRPADSGRDGHRRTEGYEDVALYTSPQAQPAQNDAARIDWLTNNPVAALDIFGHVKGADAVRWIRQEIDRAIEAHHNIKENI